MEEPGGRGDPSIQASVPGSHAGTPPSLAGSGPSPVSGLFARSTVRGATAGRLPLPASRALQTETLGNITTTTGTLNLYIRTPLIRPEHNQTPEQWFLPSGIIF